MDVPIGIAVLVFAAVVLAGVGAWYLRRRDTNPRAELPPSDSPRSCAMIRMPLGWSSEHRDQTGPGHLVPIR